MVTLRGVLHIVTIIHDLTESKAAAELLREKDELYRSILLASPDDITITDIEGRLLLVSEAANRVFGYPRGFDYSKLTISDFIAPADLPRARETILSMHQGTYVGPNYYRGIRWDGSHFDIEVNSGLIPDADGRAVKMVFIARDVTERKKAEAKIHELICQLEEEKARAVASALTDSLTELPNRRAFDEALLMEFSRFRRSGEPFSLIVLDIDHFKRYNDCYGHLMGDECLRQVAKSLKVTVGRLPDIAARYGGEEFVILLPGTGAEGVSTVARKIVQSFAELRILHAASVAAPYITASLGLATAVPGAVTTAEQVVLMADRALYRAKAGGRNRFEVATASDGITADPA
jgi:diguanylate cyclase (GGDEF)-like protein/PAS domain S-box-containing protein